MDQKTEDVEMKPVEKEETKIIEKPVNWEWMEWVMSRDHLEPEKYESTLGVVPDVLGFKFVQFWFDDYTVSRGAALLWLQISQRQNVIKESHETKVIVPSVDGLKKGVKYRTGEAQVIGVQFVGLLADVKKMTLAYLQDMGTLRSNYDKHFTYQVEKVASVPECREVTSGCGHGIHFFTDIEDARLYWNDNLLIDSEWPVITRKLRKTPGPSAIAAVTHEFIKKYHLDGELQLKKAYTAYSQAVQVNPRDEYILELVNQARVARDLPAVKI